MVMSREEKVMELIQANAPPDFLQDEDACLYLCTLLSSGSPAVDVGFKTNDHNVDNDDDDDEEEEEVEDIGRGAFFATERALANLIGQFFGDAITTTNDGNDKEEENGYGLSEATRALAKGVADLAREEKRMTIMVQNGDKSGVSVMNTMSSLSMAQTTPANVLQTHSRPLKLDTDVRQDGGATGNTTHKTSFHSHTKSEEERNSTNVKMKKKKQTRQERKAALRQKRSNKKSQVHATANVDDEEAKSSVPSDHDDDDGNETTAAAVAEKVKLQSAAELEELDDYGTAWAQCQEEGRTWGGRGYGGRGIRGATNAISNIHLGNVTLQYAGNELLQNSTIQITQGRRYGLLDRNGVGKSTLLRRLAAKAIPGLPRDLRVLLVQQQVEGGKETAIESLLGADVDRSALLAQQDRLERELDEATSNPNGSTTTAEELAEIAERLANIVAELDAIDADRAEERARDILSGLQFTTKMMESPTEDLSGGWRMRLALARALFVPSDLLLLDEPTNHLDFHALLWLSDYLCRGEHTLIVVSHDRSFLDDVCTDIINFEHKKLKYHVGNFSAFEQQQQERAARQAQILDASERQRAKAVAFVEKQQASASKKSQDPKKLRQAKMIKEKKLDRIGNYREDGKRYKNRSLKKLSEDHIRMAEKVVIEQDEPVLKFKFPSPSWAPGMMGGGALFRMEDVSFGYDENSPPLLRGLTLDLNPGSKVAVVGRNGAGKSTLLKLITGELTLNPDVKKYGEIWRHPCLRVGHVTQYHVETMDQYASMTVVEYAEEYLRNGTGCSSIAGAKGGNIRSYLGGFGLGGKHANRLVGSLSGGERMRLCFATVLSEQPHLLVLDEPTNHLDLETLDALASALNAFDGAVVIVSHNQGFLCGFCKELWVVEGGLIEVRHSDLQGFGDMFSKYRAETIQGARDRSTARQIKATMAKRANQQRAGVVRSGGFIS